MCVLYRKAGSRSVNKHIVYSTSKCVKKLVSSECLAYPRMLFSLVAALYCPLVLHVGALSNVNLFHMHVYCIYNDYICSFQEGDQELCSADFDDQADIFDGDGEKCSGLKRPLSAKHRFPWGTLEGGVKPFGMTGQTHLRCFLKQSVPCLRKVMQGWKASTDGAYHRDGYKAVRVPEQISALRSGPSFHALCV